MTGRGAEGPLLVKKATTAAPMRTDRLRARVEFCGTLRSLNALRAVRPGPPLCVSLRAVTGFIRASEGTVRMSAVTWHYSVPAEIVLIGTHWKSGRQSAGQDNHRRFLELAATRGRFAGSFRSGQSAAI